MSKRVFDLIFACVALIVLAPVFIGTGLFILVVSGRPMIFRQERVGKHGIPFTMYKFRNMYEGSPLLPLVTSPNDPRLLPGAALMRGFFIDELPQLINVLKGDMSLLGPRPMPTIMARELERTVPGYIRRYEVLPGMTGLEQLWPRLKRFKKGQHACSRLDAYYAKKHGVCLDIATMLKTIPIVLKRSGL